MMPKLAQLLVGGLTATVVAGAAVGGSALAQVGSQAPTPTKPAAEQPVDVLLNALASRLGKTPDEVRAAVVAAQKELVDQAAAAGRLTADQAARLKQRIDQAGGRGALVGPRFGARPPRVAPPPRPTTTGLTQFLGGGLTARQLGQELRSGQSLAQVAQAHGKSRDELKKFLTDQARARFDALVRAGRLTQDRANQMLQTMTDNLDRTIDRVQKQPPKGSGRIRPGDSSL
jgi:polyhydroxyalkanoate synthesis regulator phasin